MVDDGQEPCAEGTGRLELCAGTITPGLKERFLEDVFGLQSSAEDRAEPGFDGDKERGAIRGVNETLPGRGVHRGLRLIKGWRRLAPLDSGSTSGLTGRIILAFMELVASTAHRGFYTGGASRREARR